MKKKLQKNGQNWLKIVERKVTEFCSKRKTKSETNQRKILKRKYVPVAPKHLELGAWSMLEHGAWSVNGSLI